MKRSHVLESEAETIGSKKSKQGRSKTADDGRSRRSSPDSVQYVSRICYIPTPRLARMCKGRYSCPSTFGPPISLETCGIREGSSGPTFPWMIQKVIIQNSSNSMHFLKWLRSALDLYMYKSHEALLEVDLSCLVFARLGRLNNDVLVNATGDIPDHRISGANQSVQLQNFL